jgi:serine/threonine protein kinase
MPGSAAERESEILLGRYRVGERIGLGAFGIVHVAVDLSLGREVALKRLLHAEPSHVARLEREAKATSRIQHANVVQVLDLGRDASGQPFVVMERLVGPSLADLLDESGPLHAAEGLRLARELVSALQAVHAEGIVHRDLKPGNIVCARTREGVWTAKLIDFGLARILETESERLTTRGQVVGSPAYWAPEIFRNEEPDTATDLYGLGATLFEALTGRPPHEGATAAVVRASTLTKDAPSLLTLRPEVDPALAALVAGLLARAPEMRIEACATFLQKDAAHPLRDARAVIDAKRTLLGAAVAPSPTQEGMGEAPAIEVLSTLNPTAGATDHAPALGPAPVVLAGRYRRDRILGEGGMGIVYEGLDHTLQRPVALKVLRAANSPVLLERFEREARAVGQLGHPNIVAVSDVGREGAQSFLVMELLRGESLASLLRRKHALGSEEVVDLALQVLDALNEAHALGMVHRDIKPENVFVVPLASGARLVKLLDFGIV